MATEPLRRRNKKKKRKALIRSLLKWSLSLAATLLFFGIIGLFSLYFYQNHKIYMKETNALQNQWQKDQKEGFPANQVAILEKLLDHQKAKTWGPFPATWFTTKENVQKQYNQLQQVTQSLWSSAVSQEKQKATSELQDLEKLEGSFLSKAKYKKALKQASTPKEFKDLVKKWADEATKWRGNQDQLKKLSGGMVGGSPADVVHLRVQLTEILKKMGTNKSEWNVLTEANYYLKLPPPQQIAKHSTLIKQLKQAVTNLKNEEERAQLIKEGIFESKFKKYVASREGDVSIAVFNAGNKKTYLYNSSELFNTASIIKVTIMSTLLYQSQEKDQELTQSEKNLMTPMIEVSSNDAATKLWNLVGRAAGMQKFLDAADMTHTTPGTDGQWGLTKTTAVDQIRLLKLLAYPNEILNEENRSYALSLMENVTNWEDWGVSSGVSEAQVALKNGWLPYPEKWWVNSVGYVHGNGRNYCIAILTKGSPSEKYGIQTDNDISQMVWNKLGVLNHLTEVAVNK